MCDSGDSAATIITTCPKTTTTVHVFQLTTTLSQQPANLLLWCIL